MAFSILGMSKREVLAKAKEKGDIKTINYFENHKGVPQLISIYFQDGTWIQGFFDRRTRRIKY